MTPDDADDGVEFSWKMCVVIKRHHGQHIMCASVPNLSFVPIATAREQKKRRLGVRCMYIYNAYVYKQNNKSAHGLQHCCVIRDRGDIFKQQSSPQHHPDLRVGIGWRANSADLWGNSLFTRVTDGFFFFTLLFLLTLWGGKQNWFCTFILFWRGEMLGCCDTGMGRRGASLSLSLFSDGNK